MKIKLIKSSIFLLMMFVIITNSMAQFGDRIKLNGYSSFEFEKQFGDEGAGDPNASFDSDLFDLVINVYATNKLRVATDITWEHGAATEDGRGNAALEYAFGEYSINNYLKVRAGKMFTHFGIYNEIHTAKPAFTTVKEPLSTNKNHKFGSEYRFYPRWITGLAFLGNGSLSNMDFDYILQIANGEQENTNPYEEDNNIEKAISGRLRFNPIMDLRCGFSFYSDQITELDTLGEDSGNRTQLFSVGVQAEWSFNNLGLEFEYVTGKLTPSMGSEVSRFGYTAMATYKIKDIYTPYLRMEFLDPNSKVDDDNAALMIYGVNIQIDTGLFLKMEINSVSPNENNQYFEGTSYSEFKTAIAIGF